MCIRDRADVDGVDGGHNGKNYMAYTYYVRNAGKEEMCIRDRCGI